MEGRPAPGHRPETIESLPKVPGGGFVVLDGEIHYRISAYDRMPAFLMSIPSATDLWMFVASGGGLTAGRRDAEGSLFPYLTVDQLHDAHHHTGPLTLVRVEDKEDGDVLWEPFHRAGGEDPAVERNLYKNVAGNRLVFEETHHGLGLAFRYAWSASDEFGWIRTATLENRSDQPVSASLLDGLRNVLPYGAPLGLYQSASNLVDAYKKTEVDAETGLGIFSLTAGITDRAEAVEVLRANTVWCCGLPGARVHLSLEAIDAFRRGVAIPSEEILDGKRGNYLVSRRLDMEAHEVVRWHLAADSGRDHARIAEMRRRLLAQEDLGRRIDTNLREGSEALRRDVASADGLQVSGRPESWSHHFANVLFNNMRGGVFAMNHDVPRTDFVDFLKVHSPAVAERRAGTIAALPDPVGVEALRGAARETGDADFQRLCREYLPLHFGRRHGDPSRPWNRFSIRVRNEQGDPLLSYEGNWRDIFQNWEALCVSFPAFLPNVVAKFVNASTVDGFNPYRISREGIDWEKVEADDPWSNIGYWGDHQIVYLLRLLEAWRDHDPDAIDAALDDEIYSYANVPYRIKPYADLLADPADTIDFDDALDREIEARFETGGADAKLIAGDDGAVLHANLFEKLLVPALSKLSNLVPDAGIWMNTQRPEWNDANNALAGGGISVVTMCHLRRYLDFLAELLENTPARELPVSTEIFEWFDRIQAVLEREQDLLAGDGIDAPARKRVLDALGEAFGLYRANVYRRGFSGRTPLPVRRAADLCRTALRWLDWGIARNRRRDGLFHTYNLLSIPAGGGEAHVERLQEMLEGQVAALSSGLLDARESLEILEKLFASELYTHEERSFLLYPERKLPGFLAKNRVPEAGVTEIPLLHDLITARDRSLIERDADGVWRFRPELGNAQALAAALDELGEDEERAEAVDRDRDAVLELYESVFNHHSYTGRSGTMYGYEGLGCIYWHMVAKLLLAVQESCDRAARDDAPDDVQAGLARMYYRVRAGIGYEKTVSRYGAFPTDPYSHTPPAGGAKQPGMTGQVKEEILTRRGELGVHIQDGCIEFAPALLKAAEFLGQHRDFSFYGIDGDTGTIALSRGSLAFTLCQTPVVYELCGGDAEIQIVLADGTVIDRPGNRLDEEPSADILGRTGRIRLVRVGVPGDSLAAS